MDFMGNSTAEGPLPSPLALTACKHTLTHTLMYMQTTQCALQNPSASEFFVNSIWKVSNPAQPWFMKGMLCSFWVGLPSV